MISVRNKLSIKISSKLFLFAEIWNSNNLIYFEWHESLKFINQKLFIFNPVAIKVTQLGQLVKCWLSTLSKSRIVFE